ncbi:MAG: Crp/Fnr family transcriptional regulator [Chloroflexaceae bacterium]|nr:Crp/Fnr family transcriptional regulator [Chloroflexaceae bacterium]
MSDTTRHQLQPDLLGPHSQWLPQLPASLYQRALAAAQPIRLAAGQTLFGQGEPARSVYLLAAGQVYLFQLTRAGQQLGFDLVLPIRDLGLIAAVPDATYPLSAQASQPTQLLAWPHATIQQLCAAHPPLALHLMLLAHACSQQLARRTSELATLRVEQRIARVLVQLAVQLPAPPAPALPLVLPVTRQQLAELTPTTPATISRTLGAWATDGLLTAHRTTLALHDLGALHARAGIGPQGPSVYL